MIRRIVKGKDYFEAALADPERARDAVGRGENANYEEMWYVAGDAYEAATGKDDFYDRLPATPPREVQGKEWEEEELPSLFSELCKRFGY